MIPVSDGSAVLDFKIAVIGGGICGVSLAVALAKRGLECEIFEQASRFGEIGAGVAFGPNAVKALQACSPDLLEAFNKVATRNQSSDLQFSWFDWIDGFHNKNGNERWCFRLENALGANSVHRAQFLGEIVQLLPRGISHFSKRLEEIVDTKGGRIKLVFSDGTHSMADAVIGCDGIKSRTRQVILGPNHPSSLPSYTHKYAYRGLVPMEKAVSSLGEVTARNAHIYMGPGGHVLTFPVEKGAIMNVVAFITNNDEWPDHEKLTSPSTKSQAETDFHEFGGPVQAVIDLLSDDLDRWAIFDLGERPLPTYCKGRVCLVGDSAHASSPHHGAGAGLGIEDVAVLAELLDCALRRVGAASSRLALAADVEAAFKAFDRSRRERTQWLVQSSRRVGDLYEWRAEGVGDDITAIHKELKWRCERIWEGDVQDFIANAKKDLQDRLSSTKTPTE